MAVPNREASVSAGPCNSTTPGPACRIERPLARAKDLAEVTLEAELSTRLTVDMAEVDPDGTGTGSGDAGAGDDARTEPKETASTAAASRPAQVFTRAA